MTEQNQPVPPIGAELTIQQLFQALRWKFKQHESSSLEAKRISKPFALAGMPTEIEEPTSLLEDSHQFIAELSAFRNSFAPINCLPVEVMTKVLRLLQRDATIRLSHFPLDCAIRPMQIFSWLKTFTLVCQYWRRITLSNPSFWTTILVNSSIPTNLFFTRSTSSPLQIVVTSLPSKQHESGVVRFISLFKVNCERLERLTLIDSKAFKNYSFRYLLGLPFPNLKSFELDCGGDHDDANISLLDMCAPKLERLALYHCDELWRARPLLSTSILTKLSLFHCDYIAVDQFLSILKSVPRLQELDLHMSCPKAPFHSMDSHKALETELLPHLKRISLYHFDTVHDHAFYFLFKLELHPLVDIRWNKNCVPPIDPSIYPPLILSNITSLLLNEHLEQCRLLSHAMLLHHAQMNYFRQYLCNVRTLYLPNISSANGWGQAQLAKREWSTHFSSVEHLHIEPDSGDQTIQDIIHDLEQLQDPIYPNLAILNIWLRFCTSVGTFLDRRKSWRNDGTLFTLADIVDETGRATRTRANGSTYVIQLRPDGDGPALFSWHWMVAQSD